MKALICGGCKSGKTSHAQRMVETKAPEGMRIYLATMRPVDFEDEQRIARHQSDRAGKGYVTVECGSDLVRTLFLSDDMKTDCVEGNVDWRGSAVLFDSVTAYLMNAMFLPDGAMRDAKEVIESVVNDLAVLGRHAKDIVYVSDALYSDAIRYEEGTGAFRFALGEITTRLADTCDHVYETAGGLLLSVGPRSKTG